MRTRGVVTGLAAIGALAAGIAAQSRAWAGGSLAWAVLAGVGLSLMLRAAGLRVVAALLAVVAGGGAAWAVQAGQWAALAGFAVAALAAAAMTVLGPGWARPTAADEARPVDLWQAMDAGDDPTADADQARGV